jgi:hypothetical protein
VSQFAYRRAVFRVTFILLLVGWGAAWATAHVIHETPRLDSLPWLQVVISIAIAGWGGITATLGRYLASQYDETPFILRLELAKDAAVSVTVGMGSYLGGAWYGLTPMLLGLSILLAGFLGVRLLSGAADRMLAVVFSRKEQG